MAEFLRNFVSLVIFPGLLFSAAIGAITSWVDRKITARLQYRQGPPWFQAFADIFKLMGKEIILPTNVSRILFFGAPLIGFSGIILAATMLWNVNESPNISFVGDLIVLLYILTLPSLSIILAGFISKNSLAIIGSSREMKLMLAYELPFIISIFTVAYKAGTILCGQILQFQASHGMTVISLSGMLAFIAALLCVQAKLGFVPFDIAEAEQEIAAGSLIEYSGAALAIFKASKLILFYSLVLFLVTLFWGGISLLDPLAMLFSILKYLLIVLLIIVIKNTNPRLREDQVVSFFWGPVTFIAGLGMILALMGL